MIKNKELLLFEIITNANGTRSQIVTLLSAKNIDVSPDEVWLLVNSQVGMISNPDSAVLALRYANKNPLINIALDEENILSVRMVADLKKSPDELWPFILNLAIPADTLEETLFSRDVR
jgi:hypothetical protein